MTDRRHIPWRVIVSEAIDEAMFGYENSENPPTKEEFLGTFQNFYEELVWENTITLWPVDPPGSHRMAKSRAAVVWADEYSSEIPQ